VQCANAQADPEAALDMLRRAEAGAPPRSPLLVKALMSQASVLSAAGRPDEVLTLVQRAAELDPTVDASFQRPLQLHEDANHNR
jgi:tetratricopeptide (TPR) repeat protein